MSTSSDSGCGCGCLFIFFLWMCLSLQGHPATGIVFIIGLVFFIFG